MEVKGAKGRQAATHLNGTMRLGSLEEGLYKGGVLIIQKAHHNTLILG